MDKTRESAKRRLLKGLEITGWNSTTLAKEAGVAPSTINRFVNQDVGYTISFKTMTKVDEAVKRYIHSLPDASETIRLTIEYEGSGHLKPSATDIITFDVRGIVQAGYWSEAVEWDQEDWQKITLSRPDAHKNYFGLRVQGTSMNQEYSEGTILVCVPIHDYGHSLQERDHVIVQRWERGQVESTVKELGKSPSGEMWLWPRSNDPAHQTPIALPKNTRENYESAGDNQVKIVAVVVADYRVRQRSKPS